MKVKHLRTRFHFQFHFLLNRRRSETESESESEDEELEVRPKNLSEVRQTIEALKKKVLSLKSKIKEVSTTTC
jgi:predicted RNase H-like nuclease (RuvC/YqgF family)